ncbi:MAG: YihY/virulence factor BrkB family protein [Solirubrobacterales bacterium]|nr:YihY/virulence factor BrkB family protein [Solirubrobacterales bacterium]
MPLLRRIDSYQRHHRWLGVPVAIVKKFGDDGANREAALIAWWGFFSLFPLLLLFTAILGFVLSGDPGAQQSIRDSALQNFPVVGPQLANGKLDGSTTALVVGIVGALLSGIAVTLAAQDAFNKVYAVPKRERPNPIKARLRGLALLAVLGTLQIAATAATAVLSGLGGFATNVLGIGVGFVANLALFFAVFRLLTDRIVPTSHLRPGIISAAVLWTIILRVGGIYTQHVVSSAGNTYGTFAVVLGLLTWLYVGARVLVYSAEFNSVLTARLWPRSLFGEPQTEADFRAKAAVARIEEQTGDERIVARFGSDGETRELSPTVPHGPVDDR